MGKANGTRILPQSRLDALVDRKGGGQGPKSLQLRNGSGSPARLRGFVGPHIPRRSSRVPTRFEANQIVEEHLDVLADKLEREMDADVLSFIGPIYYGADDAIRDAVERPRTKKRLKLAVVLETGGGYIEVVQRIADTLRHHYPKRVEFVVPNHAMSAGTVLVMSGDAIHMDYYSVLGPIDPQVERERPDGTRSVPALGYLLKYDELIKKSAAGTLTTAELSFLLERFDPAELHEFEQARNLSISLLKEWLVKYKFKDWHKTKTQQKPVTPEMREARAKDIAEKLNDTTEWHVHGRGIPMAVLTSDKLKLEIDDFGLKPELNDRIRPYYKALVDYMGVRGASSAVHGYKHFKFWR